MSTKKIKKINVTITYSVGLGELSIPESIYNEIQRAHEEGVTLDTYTTITLNKFPNAIDWMAENIKEKDCFRWECEIDEFE